MMKRMILISSLLLTIVSTGRASGDSADFSPRDLDKMIEHGTPGQKGSVELLPLPLIQIEAQVAAPPKVRKTHYLMHVLEGWGLNRMPAVTHGLDIHSLKGHQLNVYMEDQTAKRALAALSVDDRVTLYGYHVYNSKYGPGILVSDFDRHTEWQQFSAALKTWFEDIDKPAEKDKED